MTIPDPNRFDPALFDSYKDQTELAVAFTDGMDFLNRWIYDLCRPHLGRRILEIGPGGGAMIRQLVRYHAFDRYLGVELSPRHTEALRQAYAHLSHVTFLQQDILTKQGEMTETGFDCVVAISCLEHILEDAKVVVRMGELVRPGGKIIFYLPAMPVLYNQADHLIGHYRRYNKAMLRDLASRSGLRLVVLRYCNLPGILSWFVHGRKAQAAAFAQDVVPSPWLTRFIVPYLKLENYLPLPVGLNLFCVLEKI